jgi:HD-GYP domain-containing protein (c-di-GMP phosphodiesterase class II)
LPALPTRFAPCRRTSPTAALGHQEALEELHSLRGRMFNPALMEQFVQCVGLYPIGTLLELSTGEVGVVIQQNRVQRSGRGSS